MKLDEKKIANERAKHSRAWNHLIRVVSGEEEPDKSVLSVLIKPMPIAADKE